MNLKSNSNFRQNYAKISGFVQDILVEEEGVSSYFIIQLEVRRTSGKIDIVPIYLEHGDFIFKNSKKTDVIFNVGDYLVIEGDVTSFFDTTKKTRNKLRVHSYVHAKIIEALSIIPATDFNEIKIQGTIGKYPCLRVTSKNAYIVDVFLRLNETRKEGIKQREVYVPCIFFNKCADVAQQLVVGDDIYIYGRFQSRNYYSNKLRTSLSIYEVSALQFTVLDKTNEIQREEAV